jgi:hypothetical protein
MFSLIENWRPSEALAKDILRAATELLLTHQFSFRCRALLKMMFPLPIPGVSRLLLNCMHRNPH